MIDRPSHLDHRSHLRSIVAAPEFGPFVLLAVELFVFWAINHNFLSPLNISNTLAFTVELGLIALTMTLLMTAGEFDLSVGSVFGFSPVLMWTLYNQGILPLELAFVAALGISGADRLGQRLVRDLAEDPLVPGHARHAARGQGYGAVRDRRLPATDLEGRRHAARDSARRRLHPRRVPPLLVAVLVHRCGRGAWLCADADALRQLDPGRGGQRQRGPGPRRQRPTAPRSSCSCCRPSLRPSRASSARSAPRPPTPTAAPATNSRSSPWW